MTFMFRNLAGIPQSSLCISATYDTLDALTFWTTFTSRRLHIPSCHISITKLSASFCGILKCHQLQILNANHHSKLTALLTPLISGGSPPPLCFQLPNQQSLTQTSSTKFKTKYPTACQAALFKLTGTPQTWCVQSRIHPLPSFRSLPQLLAPASHSHQT